jgi:hypothetical protein
MLLHFSLGKHTFSRVRDYCEQLTGKPNYVNMRLWPIFGYYPKAGLERPTNATKTQDRKAGRRVGTPAWNSRKKKPHAHLYLSDDVS